MMNILHPFTRVSRFHSTSHAARYVVDFIDELDWIVGEVMEAPETAGVTGNPLLVFTSDDGGMLAHVCDAWSCDLSLDASGAPATDADACCLPTCEATFNAEDPDNPGSNYDCPDGFNKREEEMAHQCAQSVHSPRGCRPGAPQSDLSD